MIRDEIVRDAEARDVQGMLDIYAYYVESTAITFEYDVPSEEEFAGRLAAVTARYPWIVLEEGGEILGYAYAGVFKNRAAYDRSCEVTIYLRNGLAKRGYGRRLYEALEERLRERGMLNLYACIGIPSGEADEYISWNSAEFHGHLGYETAGRFHKCGYKFGRWYDMVWMEKMIGEHV